MNQSPYLTIILTGLLTLPAVAQTPPATPPLTRAEIENGVRVLEQRVALQQERVAAVRASLRATDTQMERRIQKVIEYLTTVQDSEQSGTKVLRTKQAVFNALMQSLTFFGNERGQRLAKLYQPSPNVPKPELANDVKWLNERIEKRVSQALAVLTSLPAEQNVGQYTADWNGDDWSRRTNPAYVHQKLVLGEGRLLREKAVTDLKASIARLQRGLAEYERARAVAKTKEGHEFIKDLIAWNRELIAKREDELRAALTKANPGGTALGNSAADSLTEMIALEKQHNAKDKQDWLRLEGDLDRERARLGLVQAQLDYGRRRLAQAQGQAP